MKTKFETLKHHFNKEIELYNYYLCFLMTLQTDIVEGNTKEIEALVSHFKYTEQDFIDLQKTRTGLIAWAAGIEDATFSDLEPMFTNIEFEVLSEKKDKVNQLIEDVHHYNEVNKIILESALLFTQQRLNLYKQPQNDLYTVTGQAKENSYKNSMDCSI